MPRKINWIPLLLALMAAAAFCLYIPPNAAASQDISMVQMFQPDEGAPLMYVFRMVAPAKSVDAALRQFVFYEYYFYGFPYFGPSGLTVLLVTLAGWGDRIAMVMLALRQLISVLPMLAGLLLLVYLQDGFRTYRSPVLFTLLLSVPAVMANNFWWHPDGIVFLLAVLTLFFLRRDALRLGWNFIIAAALCGVTIAAKLVGGYFFLAVALVLLLALVQKKASLKRAAGMAAAFLAVMAVSFVAANPFLLSHWARDPYLRTLSSQMDWLSSGYEVVYGKGLLAAWPTMHDYYGEATFILASLGAAVWGAWRGKDRLLHGLILAWFVPVTVSVLWFTHFKFQYWLPAALPVFSSLSVALPEAWPSFSAIKTITWAALLKARSLPALAAAVIILAALAQLALFVNSDVHQYTGQLRRAEDNPRILFYRQSLDALAPLPADRALRVYHDTRLYLPDTRGWTAETTTDLLEYSYIQDHSYDVLLLMEQRIRDYLNPGVEGIDPVKFARNQQFYRDADQGALAGYHLIYRNAVGLVFVRESLWNQYWGSKGH